MHRYAGWNIYYVGGMPVTGRWYAKRYGVRICAGTKEALIEMIQKRGEPVDHDPVQMMFSEDTWELIADVLELERGKCAQLCLEDSIAAPMLQMKVDELAWLIEEIHNRLEE